MTIFLDKEIILPWVHEIFGKEEKKVYSFINLSWGSNKILFNLKNPHEPMKMTIKSKHIYYV